MAAETTLRRQAHRTLYTRDPELWSLAVERAEGLGLSLSAYIEHCITNELTALRVEPVVTVNGIRYVRAK